MNLEFFIKLREMVGSGLAKMAETARKTTAAIKGTNDMLGQSYDAIRGKVQQLEAVIRSSTSVRQIREARSELERLQRVQMRHPANIGGSEGFFAGALRSALPAFGIAAALSLGGSMLNKGLEAQATQASFEVLAGKEGGTRLNQNLTKYAQDSIYGNEVYKNAQTMLGFGLKESEVMPSLRMIGDIAMGDANKLGSLTLAFSQVRAAGRLTGQDLLQFINAGFNPLQQMSKDTGLGLAQLKKKMEDGAISFGMVQTAFQHATSEGGMFYKMTEKIAQTDFGKWQAFTGQIEGLAVKIGGLLAPALGYLIDNLLVPLVNALSATVEWGKQNVEWLQPLAVGVIAAAGAYGIFLAVMNAGTIATTLMSGAMKILNLVMSLNPIGAIIALIAALVAGIIYAWNHFEGFRKVVFGLWEVFKQVFENIGNFFKKIFEPIFEAIDAIKSGEWGKAAIATGKLLFNLTPIGLAANAVSFTKEGGLTKGVSEAWDKGKEKGKESFSASQVEVATPKATTLSNAVAPQVAPSSTGEEAVKGVTSGGPRIINITISKLVEKIEVHTAKLDESLEDIEDKVKDTFLRVLNSGASVQ